MTINPHSYTADDILARLVALSKQAIMEKSHYYVAATCLEAIAEIERLRGTNDAQDAARYRWLREANDCDWNALLRDGGEEMDAAIDKRIPATHDEGPK